MHNFPNTNDLYVFLHVVKRSSFAAAASELGMSTAYISKRIRVLEEVMAVQLLHRSTRRVSVTEDGERVYEWAQKILDSMLTMNDEVASLRSEPSGRVRVVSSQGLGRKLVAPALRLLAEKYPNLDVRLDISDHLVDLVAEGFDLDIRVGNEISPLLIAKPLASNRRVLCASPQYLAIHGMPETLDDLADHNCLAIKERDHPFGVWHLEGPQGTEAAKVTGNLSTNHGEIARDWCLNGGGILLRSLWDIHVELSEGRLVRVLPEYYQSANIWAVHATPILRSAKIRVIVEFMQEYFTKNCSIEHLY